jgi:hypothetical protein
MLRATIKDFDLAADRYLACIEYHQNLSIILRDLEEVKLKEFTKKFSVTLRD